jgi:hypothetical protein
LEKWHLVPIPSPVLTSNFDSNGDIDDDRKALRRHDTASRLSVTCHHGTHSHITMTRLSSSANFSSALDPLELYQLDEQPHAELAYNLQLDPNTLEHSVEDELSAARSVLSLRFSFSTPSLSSLPLLSLSSRKRLTAKF